MLEKYIEKKAGEVKDLLIKFGFYENPEHLCYVLPKRGKIWVYFKQTQIEVYYVHNGEMEEYVYPIKQYTTQEIIDKIIAITK